MAIVGLSVSSVIARNARSYWFGAVFLGLLEIARITYLDKINVKTRYSVHAPDVTAIVPARTSDHSGGHVKQTMLYLHGVESRGNIAQAKLMQRHYHWKYPYASGIHGRKEGLRALGTLAKNGQLFDLSRKSHNPRDQMWVSGGYVLAPLRVTPDNVALRGMALRQAPTFFSNKLKPNTVPVHRITLPDTVRYATLDLQYGDFCRAYLCIVVYSPRPRVSLTLTDRRPERDGIRDGRLCRTCVEMPYKLMRCPARQPLSWRTDGS
ncbi:hypothetical protein QBC46DRAFT_446209 [Diplogelasinospora grovesii]|uniref:Uncharacterized protein n=1 Tax=Diplogelasinospora grovesii TaxID=303347 RepID=A0AAN6S8E8_9PEZI|nr:hypothetical protein QBC46DRAFT_446209 [Diplogelasinospora grovesii]